MNNITKENEFALAMDILKYIHIAIEDKNVDCDILIAVIMAKLENEQNIDLDRVMYFYSRFINFIARRK